MFFELRNQVTDVVLQFIPADLCLLLFTPGYELGSNGYDGRCFLRRKMTDEMETKTTDVQGDDDKLFDSKRLMSTSSQAMLLSWLFLAVIVLFGINLIIFLYRSPVCNSEAPSSR